MSELSVVNGNIVLKEYNIVPTRKQIVDLQNLMMKIPVEQQFDCTKHLKHIFCNGLYAREFSVPKDIVVVTRIHKSEHITVVSKGKCMVYTDEGTKIIDATENPVTFKTLPGTKRVVHVLEDTVWTTIHITNETDLDKLLDELTVNEEDYLKEIT